MQKKPAILTKADIPAAFHSFLDGAAAFDSSCSKTAQVWFLDKGPGYFLKKAPKGTLKNEAAMTAFFSSKNLAPEVLAYESYTEDWMLTLRAKGEDCLLSMYTDDPKKLCDTTAQLLRMLHESDTANCPVADRTRDYLSTTIHNFHHKNYDSSLFPDNWGYRCAEDAIAVVERFAPLLKADTLIHGDFCLPNVMLNNWQFSGLIDLGAAGAGDRHLDLFWGAWSLGFNLKTDAYRDRFFDAYGRDRIDFDILNSIGAFEVFA